VNCGVLKLFRIRSLSRLVRFYGWSWFVIFLFACSTEGVADKTVFGQIAATMSALLSL